MEGLSTTEVAEEGTVDESAAAEICGVPCSFFVFIFQIILLLFARTFIFDDGKRHGGQWVGMEAE